jgi:hypothetical protein
VFEVETIDDLDLLINFVAGWDVEKIKTSPALFQNLVSSNFQILQLSTSLLASLQKP